MSNLEVFLYHSHSLPHSVWNILGKLENFVYHSWFVPLLVLCVSVGNIFMKLDAGTPDYTYRAFGDLFFFVYCLLQKIESSHSLPVIENWGAHMLPNYSVFVAIEEERFLEGTPVQSALEKFSSYYLRSDFRKRSRQLLEELVWVFLSTSCAFPLLSRIGLFLP